MSEYLFNYERVDPTTWVYLSSLLSLGLFFKFNRFWSMRNLDLVLLILLAPGLLLVYSGRLEQRKVIRAGARDNAIVEYARSHDNGDATTDDDAATEPTQLAALRETQVKMRGVEFSGFLWLIVVNALLVIRLLVDPNMVRRPLLEPNLSSGGLTFLCVSLFIFLMANVVASAPVKPPSETDEQVAEALKSQDERTWGAERREVRQPGYILLTLFPRIPTTPLTADVEESGSSASLVPDKAPPLIGPESSGPEIGPDPDRDGALVTAARCIAIMSHLAIVFGIATVGYRHFDSLRTGIGAATLYLMLPYTSQMTGHIDHSIPAALLVWAVVFYRRPATAGVFLGLAMGCYYYPLFLLPLWISFYWQRGLGRFLGGILSMLAVLIALLLLKSSSGIEFLSHLRTMFGAWTPLMEGLQGVWGLGWDPWYRVPVLALFVGIISTLAIWPAQKNLGTLISCSGAVMVATQAWHGFGGGLYMGWFLPLLLLTIFRPNLEDRIALAVLGEVWFPRRKRIAA
jgi:hypothetical protein